MQVDAVLAVIATDGAGARTATRASARRGREESHAPTEAAPASPPPEAAGSVSAPLPTGDADAARGRRAVASDRGAEGERILATPIARKIAAAEGVDLAQRARLRRQGRVTKEDMLRAIEQRRPRRRARARSRGVRRAARAPSRRGIATCPPRPSPQPPAPADFHVRPWVEGERVEIEPMSRIRQLTARAHGATRRTPRRTSPRSSTST